MQSDREIIFQKLVEISKEQMTVNPEDIKEDMLILKDCGLDSLSITFLILNIEKTFNFEFKEEDLPNIETVGDLISLIARNTA